MSLQDKLLEDTQEAMRNRDKVRRSVLSFLRSAVHNEEIRKQSKLEDDEVIEVISRQAKQIKESITEFTKGNRPDLVIKEQADLLILQEYLPTQMSKDEILKIAKLVINSLNAEGPSDKGNVMAQLMPQVKGKADGSLVNKVVTQLLEG
jgi:hypothetical protein